MHVLLNCLSLEIQTIKWGARENKGQTVNDRRNSNAQMGGSILRDVTKTGNGERGAGNGERKSGNELSAETSIKIQNGR